MTEPNYAKLQEISATAEREAPLTQKRWEELFEQANKAAAGFPVAEFMFEFQPGNELRRPVDDGEEWEEDDDDTAEPAATRKFLPPVEVSRAAKRAWGLGVSIIGITEPLAKGEGITLEEVRQIADHFADVNKRELETDAACDAWGGLYAERWAGRVFKKAQAEGVVKPTGDQPREDELVYVAVDADRPEMLAEYLTKHSKAEQDREEYPFEIEGDVAKLDDERRLVFGWFSVVEIEGKTLTDMQGDRIKEHTLEEAVYDYVLHARVGGHMHEDGKDDEIVEIGKLVESVVFTKEKQRAMLRSLRAQGIPAELDLHAIAWWGGFKIEDKKVWEDIKSGKLKAFSVGGKGKREKQED